MGAKKAFHEASKHKKARKSGFRVAISNLFLFFRTNKNRSEQRLLFHDLRLAEAEVFAHIAFIRLTDLADALEDDAVCLAAKPLRDFSKGMFLHPQVQDLPLRFRKPLHEPLDLIVTPCFIFKFVVRIGCMASSSTPMILNVSTDATVECLVLV